MSRLNDAQRHDLAMIYRDLIARFGVGHVLRRMHAGWLIRAAHSRVEVAA